MRFPVWAIVSLSILFALLAALITYSVRSRQRADWFRVFSTGAIGAIFLTLPFTITTYQRIQESREAIRRLEGFPVLPRSGPRSQSQSPTQSQPEKPPPADPIEEKENRYGAQVKPPSRFHAGRTVGCDGHHWSPGVFCAHGGDGRHSRG
jgi:hypothetical protein